MPNELSSITTKSERQQDKTDLFSSSSNRINQSLYKKGIIAFDANPNIKSTFPKGKNQFTLNKRDYVITYQKKKVNVNENVSIPHPSSVADVVKLLTSLITFTQNDPFLKLLFDSQASLVIHNKQHKDEVFLPVLHANPCEKSSLMGSYLYPWVAHGHNTPVTFHGFSKYVIPGCFIPNIRGQDQKGFRTPLIKHDLSFSHEQQIVAIIYDEEEESPYELMQLKDLEIAAYLMNLLSKRDSDFEVLYHLPGFDYILSAIWLWLENQIIDDALDDFIKSILKKVETYSEKIRDIFSKYINVKLKIESPFQNLFRHVFVEEDKTAALLADLDIQKDPNGNYIKPAKQEFILRCLKKLRENKYNLQHQLVWKEFIVADTEIQSIEDLFDVGNACMVALICRGTENHSICSMSSIHEKQIQIFYEKKRHQANINHPNAKYSAPVNINMLGTLFPFEPGNKGDLFYFNGDNKKLLELIKGNEIRNAYQNVGLFAKKVKGRKLVVVRQQNVELLISEKDLNNEINTLEVQKQKIDNDIKQLKTDLNKLNLEKAQNDNENQNIKKADEMQEKNKKLKQLKEIKSLEKRLENATELEKKLQNINNGKVKDIEKRLENVKREKLAIQGKLDTLKLELSSTEIDSNNNNTETSTVTEKNERAILVSNMKNFVKLYEQKTAEIKKLQTILNQKNEVDQQELFFPDYDLMSIQCSQ